jgi:hypothetical protein
VEDTCAGNQHIEAGEHRLMQKFQGQGHGGHDDYDITNQRTRFEDAQNIQARQKALLDLSARPLPVARRFG